MTKKHDGLMSWLVFFSQNEAYEHGDLAEVDLGLLTHRTAWSPLQFSIILKIILKLIILNNII